MVLVPPCVDEGVPPVDPIEYEEEDRYTENSIIF